MKILFLIISILLLSNPVISQEIDEDKILKEKKPEGTEFWLCFMRNHNESGDGTNATPLDLKLFLTSDNDANVSVEIKSINFKEQIFVQGGTVRALRISPLAQIRSSEVVEAGRGIHVTSDVPISVYGLNRRKLTTDTFLGLPVNVIGKRYRTMCYDISVSLMSEFAVVATENNTEVKITPTVQTDKGKEPGKPFTITLNKGDVYQVAAKKLDSCILDCDLTGTLVEADKKISVFSGHQCAYVPTDIIACNHLVEQLPPINSWGKNFYIGALKKRSKYNYRVLANEDDTKVFEDSKLLSVLNAGQYLEKETSRSVQITATKPVLVAQYSQGFDNGDRIGDPMMLLVSPTQQFLMKYRFATPVDGSWEHFINVVAPSDAINSMSLNGLKIDPKKFSQLGNSRYSFAQISVNYGTHVIEGDKPFGMTSYGFGFDEDKYDAYGTLAGQSFLEYVDLPDTLRPFADTRSDKDGYSVLFRDDRNIDKGIADVDVISNEGFDFDIQPFEEGTPLVIMNFGSKKYDKNLSVKLEVTDVAGNRSKYTVCYSYNQLTNRFEYSLNEGHDVTCSDPIEWEYGAFIGYNYITHEPSFRNTADIFSNGDFSDKTGNSFIGGVLLAYRITGSLNVAGKLSFTKYLGAIEAVDDETSSIRVEDELEPFQESTSIELEGIFAGLDLGLEYLLTQNLYLLGGIKFDIPMSSSINARRNIIIPENYVYSSGERSKNEGTEKLESLNTIGLTGNFGLGLRSQISSDISVYIETTYLKRLTNVIDDGNWTYSILSITGGVRLPLR